MNNSLETKRKINYSLKNKNRTIIGYKNSFRNISKDNRFNKNMLL